MTGISYLRLASIARADGWDVLETPASIWFEREREQWRYDMHGKYLEDMRRDVKHKASASAAGAILRGVKRGSV